VFGPYWRRYYVITKEYKKDWFEIQHCYNQDKRLVNAEAIRKIDIPAWNQIHDEDIAIHERQPFKPKARTRATVLVQGQSSTSDDEWESESDGDKMSVFLPGRYRDNLMMGSSERGSKGSKISPVSFRSFYQHNCDDEGDSKEISSQEKVEDWLMNSECGVSFDEDDNIEMDKRASYRLSPAGELLSDYDDFSLGMSVGRYRLSDQGELLSDTDEGEVAKYRLSPQGELLTNTDDDDDRQEM
jgi:hypothetical protein